MKVKKICKKVIAIMLGVFVIGTTFSGMNAEAAQESEKATTIPYQDVSSNAWYYKAVQYNYRHRTMTGLKEDQFGPDETLVRAQFATILHRMKDTPDVTYEAKFPDVSESDWYAKAVLWANSIGVVNGYSNNGYFGPADNITREQMAVMMYRYAEKEGEDISKKADFTKYADASQVSDFASDAMAWAVGNKIITGKDNGTKLDPQGNANRAECATIIMRFEKTYDSTPINESAYAKLYENGELIISSNEIKDENKTVSMDLGMVDIGPSIEIPEWHSVADNIKTVTFDGKIKPINCEAWFFECVNLEKINNIENLDTSECVNMNRMFSECHSLSELDVSGFDTSKVKDMLEMFSYCKKIKKLDVSDFDTSSVTNMNSMFAGLMDVQTLDLHTFDTSKVTDMFCMFSDCRTITSLDLSSFDTSCVKDMGGMFTRSENIKCITVSDKWTFKNVEEAGAMFDGCGTHELTGLSFEEKFPE